jgi:hypothetical protein
MENDYWKGKICRQITARETLKLYRHNNSAESLLTCCDTSVFQQGLLDKADITASIFPDHAGQRYSKRGISVKPNISPRSSGVFEG